MTATSELGQPETAIEAINMVEDLAEHCEWEFDRVNEHQIAVAIEGRWKTYSLSMIWSRHDSMLRLITTAEFAHVDESRLSEFHKLLNLVNDKIWGCSFTHWEDQQLLAFRSGLTLLGDTEATPEQIEAMVLTAFGLFERFYPAFMLVAWSNEPAEEALNTAFGQAFGTA